MCANIGAWTCSAEHPPVTCETRKYIIICCAAFDPNDFSTYLPVAH